MSDPSTAMAHEISQEPELISAARRARSHAYAPYSRFAVGAAVLSGSGEIAAGCNVENASYGLTLCAERVAVGAAVAAGMRSLVAVAVYTEMSDPVWPCGACRQVLLEFGANVTVIAAVPGRVERRRLSDLLPSSFSQRDLEKQEGDR